MAESLQYHIKCRKGDVARYVLLPGDPARVQVIASLWDESHKVAENRQYVTYTGKVSGVDISTTSTGIGSPSAAIAVEELARCGADTFIRVGTCGGYQKDQRIGDIAIASGAVRWEGTTRQYVPIEYPAVSTPEVVMALVEAAEQLGVDYHVGISSKRLMQSSGSFRRLLTRRRESVKRHWMARRAACSSATETSSSFLWLACHDPTC